MAEKFYCPMIDGDCLTPEICIEVNKPLIRAIPKIRQAVGGVAWARARGQLENELNTQGNIRGSDLHAAFDNEGTATVCPKDFLDDGLVEKVGRHSAAVTLASLTEVCVRNSISYLEFQKANPF
ncbi:MAG: hypothetical protein ACRD4B_10350 [Acidobacteriota bacterium]